MAKKTASPHHAVKLNKLVDAKLAVKLRDAGIDRVHQVRKMTDAQLKALKGIGAKAVGDIRAAIA